MIGYDWIDIYIIELLTNNSIFCQIRRDKILGELRLLCLKLVSGNTCMSQLNVVKFFKTSFLLCGKLSQKSNCSQSMSSTTGLQGNTENLLAGDWTEPLCCHKCVAPVVKCDLSANERHASFPSLNPPI